MSDERIAAMTVDAYLETMASSSPTPGGGAAGAVAAATGAALIAMVGRLTVAKKGFDDVQERMHALIASADALRTEFLDLADSDAHAFDSVMAAFKMPKESEDEKAARAAAIQAGYLAAASVPREVARKAVDMMELAEDATAMGDPQAASDGLSAGSSLYSGALSAMANVEINAASLKDEGTRHAMLDEVASLKTRAEQLLRDCQTAFELRLSN